MRILFICLGNICRSSAAEEILRQKLIDSGLSERVKVDSAGLINYHEGELPDERMRHHAKKRGYILTHRSRPLRTSDFYDFDLILGMDDANIKRLLSRAPSEAERSKVKRTTDFNLQQHPREVPDPYYGGSDGFELVLDLLEDACEGIVQYIQQTLPLDASI